MIDGKPGVVGIPYVDQYIELLPGAVRWHQYKFVFNLRGDNGAATGGLAVDSNLGWKGPEKYVATVPQIFDLLADAQERYDLFMNNFTESTWMGPVMREQLKKDGFNLSLPGQ